jgi:O-antigen/teichoic acid export membrane protein
VTIVLAGVAGVAALGLLLMTVWRPVLGCAALVFLVPLTAGLARGAVIPVLKPSEAILMIVVVGVIAHRVAVRPIRPISGLDIALGAYVVGSVGIPWALLFLTRYPATLDTWRTVLSPALFLAVYYVFSRTRLTDSDLRILLNCALAAGVIVCLVAAAELANLPMVRSLFNQLYTGPSETPYRPSSTMGHYSAVGGLGLFTYIIALSLATVRKAGFPGWWLMSVMGVSVMGVIASETWAPLATLPVATLLIVIYARRLPRELIATAVLGGAAGAILWPLINGRFAAQQLITAQGLSLPESMQTRIRYWNEFIIPALSDHLWSGTGTVIPSSVPQTLTTFVDNEYLWAGFRAGIPGVALLVGMLLVIIVLGWGQRTNSDPARRAVGGAALATSAMLIILGATAQYITFAGLSQEIAMLVGVLGVLTTQASARRAPVVVVKAVTEPVWIAIPRSLEGAMLELGRLRPEAALLRSSAVVFVGFAGARALGFLFSVAAARILNPLEFGHLTYAIAVVTVTSMFISSAPIGLSRFLSRNHSDRSAQTSYFANWLVLLAGIVVISVVVVTPLGFILGLSAGLVAGLLCNFVGIAVLEMYREIQRGLDKFAAMMSVYVIANLIQLLGIVALGQLLQVHSAALFLIVYGASSVVALAIIQPFAPITLKFSWRSLSSDRVKEIFRFIRPVLLQSVFYAVWFGSDMIMVQHFMSSKATGNYAVAKALVNVLILAPTALGTTILPRIARLREESVARYIGTALGLTALATIPLVGAAVLFGARLVALVFGSKYQQAAEPMAILAVGMGIYGFYAVIGSVWVGLGRPVIDSVATGVAMLTTLVVGIALIPHVGLPGAATAFTCGAATRLAVIGFFTVYMLGRWRMNHARAAALETSVAQVQPTVVG